MPNPNHNSATGEQLAQKQEGHVRVRRREPDGTIVCEQGHEAHDDEITLAQLRTVQTMLLEGKTQVEIANHFGRSTRTIRRWAGKAKKQRIAELQSLSPDNMLSQSLQRYRHIELELYRLKAEAEVAGDLRRVTECLSELRQTEKDRYFLLEKAHFFEGFNFVQPNEPEDDPGKKSLRVVLDMFEASLVGQDWNPENSNDNEGDDYDPEGLI